jgi:hypothetical protein
MLLHDPAVRDAIRIRVEALSPDSTRRWGRMSVGQMLWHCNQVFKSSLGDVRVTPRRPPFPIPLLKFMLLRMPWPHGAPTAPEYEAGPARDFEAERRQCLELMERFVARRVDDSGWGPAVFGELSGREWSQLHAKHLDHHLKQFSA